MFTRLVLIFIFFSCDDIGKNYSWSDKKNDGYFRKFGTEGYDYGWSLAMSHFDNGIVISGTQQPIINGDRNLWAIKTNSEGFVEWDRSFGGDANEEGYDVISTPDGGFIFGGYT